MISPAQQREKVLREVAARFPSHEPTGVDNDTVCAACGNMVSVDFQDEWNDGDVCFRCADTALANVEAFVNGELAAIAAADAIPDAPVATEHVCSVPCRMLAQATTIPSRAELIELMRDALAPQFVRVEDDMARVLDALVKAGAVRGGL